ncbi:MAG: hypothetical protein PWP46_2171 [Fusobacteriaceae bacterium]|jgi:glycosyltransferase involved in cell wall biosynthesis|nr:hypothetical protein [Fusobacteriaceae bacterium]
MDKPLVSFLIAAYNEEKYIEECIDSCLSQTYENIEVCVTDDGSTDRTLEILKRKYGTNPKVKIATLGHNKGKVVAFNNSYKMASGEYFALIGADDVALVDRIEKSLEFALKNNYDLIWGRNRECDEFLIPRKIKIQKSIEKNKINLENLLNGNFVYGSTVMFNKKIANKAFPIPESLKFEDWWLGFIAMLNGKIGFLDLELTNYRIHSKNDSIGEDLFESRKNDFKRHFAYYEEFRKYIESDKNSKSRIRLIKKIRRNILMRNIFLEKQVLKRFFYLFKELDLLSLNKIYFKIIIYTIFGNKILKLRKRF